MKYDIEPGQKWEVDLFRPEDAEGVVNLFLSVYGEGYPVKTYIDPDKLREENAAGRVISSVARTEKGDIVGHNALYNSAPYRGVYESGSGVVHKNYRGGRGIFTKMVVHGLEIAPSFDVEFVFGEPVCNHVFSQRLVRGVGAVTMGVEVDLMPAEAYVAEGSAEGRVTSLFSLMKIIKPKPHGVYLPERYAEKMKNLYGNLAKNREIALSGEPLPEGVKTNIVVQHFDFARVARLAVWEMGEDFEEAFNQVETEMRDKNVTVIQSWLNIGKPWVGEAAEALRRKGYFFGGVLPRWFDTDGMLMQKLFHDPCWDAINLYYDRDKEIVAMVKEDWESAGKG